jgi:hypothetical protein
MTDVTPDVIFQVASGFMAAKHLFVANEVGLFEHLAHGPATLEELAPRTGVPRRTLRILTDAMVALGFVERHADRYQNEPVATAFLSGPTPLDLRPFLRFWNQLSYPRWMRLEEAVRTGQRLFDGQAHPTRTAEQQRIFSEGVAALTAEAAQGLATAYAFGQNHKVLDLGGGTGSFLLAVLRQHRAVAATLFERPAVAAVARQALSTTLFADAITIVEGDFFTDPIPTGHDAIIVANVMHGLSPEHNRVLLRRIREGVLAGAHLLLVDLWTDRTRTQPLTAALMAGEFLIGSGEGSGEGDVYSAEEVHGWLQESGWGNVEHKPLAGPWSLIIADTAEA